jgi:superfamily II DNA or RNA helicase
MRIKLDLDSIDSYRLFLRIKALPSYRFVGREAWIPDEYVERLGIGGDGASLHAVYRPSPFLFDYQAGTSELAIRKKKFAIFMRCGYGKTLCFLEFARHVIDVLPPSKAALIVSPLMVIKQTIREAGRFYGDSLPIEQVQAADLPRWMAEGHNRLGITNYEALTDKVPQGRIGCLILDESSLLKSAYGEYGQQCIRIGRGLDWKLALTGTPAPNDRIEFATHSVFLDAFPTVNSFLARFFINRGQTDNRWEIKPHALRPFYKALSHWSIFMNSPATYGYKDNTDPLPAIHTHIHEVELTEGQSAAARATTGMLLPIHAGGITTRSKLSQIAKGKHNGKDIDSRKPEFIKSLVDSWPDESTIIWCRFNDEQDSIARMFPDAANIQGSTKYEAREPLIEDFQSGRRKVIVTKSECLGYGLNLQKCTRMIFSSLDDSWEKYHQAIARANRVGSTRPLNVHVPTTDLERPLIENVFRKAQRIEEDDLIQEELFRDASL